MELFKSLVLGIIVLICTLLVVFKRKSIDEKLTIFVLGIIFTLMVLVFPLYKEQEIMMRIISTIFYGFKTIAMDQDYEILGNIELNSVVNVIYVGVMYILFLLAPLSTATAILSIIGSRIAKVKMFFERKRSLLIFSELNEKTLAIAKREYEKSKPFIIFANVKEKEILGIDALPLNQEVTEISFKNKDVTYYLFSSLEEQNLIDALKIIREKNDLNIKMYVLNNSHEARVVLDSCNKGNVRLELINEVDRSIYDLLYNYPLYKESISNSISVLIVGCGQIGLEFLKAVTWCGQVIGHQLHINVIDLKASKIKEKLSVECPELLDNYEYNFVEADIYSKKAICELDKLENENINYVLVSLGNDNLNLNVALLLRRYFLRQDVAEYRRMPVINLNVTNSDKKEQIENLKYGKDVNLYNFNTFGSVREMYEEGAIIHSPIEELAKQVHGIYDPDDLNNNLKRFYETEYNRKSSRAVAVHLKYKLYATLKGNYDGNLEEDLNNNLDKVLVQFDKVKEKFKRSLMENEHERWNAYMRTDGFVKAECEEVKKYKKFTNDTKHPLAKLHPAIVSYKELKKVQSVLKKDFISSDELIIDNIEKILKQEVYKK